MNWYYRVARRFLVVFASGGVLAVLDELKLLMVSGTPEQTLYISAAIAVLAAFEKMLRDHKDAK